MDWLGFVILKAMGKWRSLTPDCGVWGREHFFFCKFSKFESLCGSFCMCSHPHF